MTYYIYTMRDSRHCISFVPVSPGFLIANNLFHFQLQQQINLLTKYYAKAKLIICSL
jgi:hypothetical protein